MQARCKLGLDISRVGLRVEGIRSRLRAVLEIPLTGIGPLQELSWVYLEGVCKRARISRSIPAPILKIEINLYVLCMQGVVTLAPLPAANESSP